MKYVLILLLLSFNAHANQYCVNVKTNYNAESVTVKNPEFNDMVKVEKWINKQVREKSWGKPDRWIEEKQFTYEKKVDALDQKEECNNLGNCVKLYYFAQDFNYEIKDCSNEYDLKEQEKLNKKAEIEAIKSDISKVESSDLPTWHKRLLIRLIKEL